MGTKEETFVVLFEVENNRSARKQCENIENYLFQIKPKEDGYQALTPFKVREAIYDFIGDDKIGIAVFPLTDFMEECNDENINLEDYFLSYVRAELIQNKQDDLNENQKLGQSTII